MPEKPPVQKLRPDQYQNPDISDEQTRRIGQVIVLWSKLKAAIDDTIWMLFNLDDENGKIVTKRLSADAKIRLLRQVGSLHISDEALLVKFSETLKYVGELKEHRNFIAHGVWGTLMPDDIPIGLSLKPKVRCRRRYFRNFPTRPYGRDFRWRSSDASVFRRPSRTIRKATSSTARTTSSLESHPSATLKRSNSKSASTPASTISGVTSITILGTGLSLSRCHRVGLF